MGRWIRAGQTATFAVDGLGSMSSMVTAPTPEPRVRHVGSGMEDTFGAPEVGHALNIMSVVDNVLIVGGGVGGLCTAIGLARHGINADIVEIQQDWVVYGVGIIQAANAIRAYDRLGIGQKCLENGFRFYSMKHFDGEGNLLGEQRLPILEGDGFGGTCGILRPKLRDVLVEEALSHATVSARFGLTVSELVENGSSIEARFTDGTSTSHDLVVGADGVHSRMRSLLFPDAPAPRYVGQGCWRVTGPRPADMDYMANYNGPKNKAGFVPLTADMLYMFVTSSEPETRACPASRCTSSYETGSRATPRNWFAA